MPILSLSDGDIKSVSFHNASQSNTLHAPASIKEALNKAIITHSTAASANKIKETTCPTHRYSCAFNTSRETRYAGVIYVHHSTTSDGVAVEEHELHFVHNVDFWKLKVTWINNSITTSVLKGWPLPAPSM